MSNSFSGLQHMFAEIASSPEHAWGVHCNIAMPILDVIGCSHQQANEAAAHLMQHLFGYDITTHPHYDYGKSGAQAYAEMRIAADREEDAEIAARGGVGAPAVLSGDPRGEPIATTARPERGSTRDAAQ